MLPVFSRDASREKAVPRRSGNLPNRAFGQATYNVTRKGAYLTTESQCRHESVSASYWPRRSRSVDRHESPVFRLQDLAAVGLERGPDPGCPGARSVDAVLTASGGPPASCVVLVPVLQTLLDTAPE